MKITVPAPLQKEQHALHEALARGAPAPEMNAVLAMMRRLKAELPEMLDEHRQIVGAQDKLRAAAREAGRPEYDAFADALILHAQTEEQVLYPAAILVGDYIALQLGQSDRQIAR